MVGVTILPRFIGVGCNRVTHCVAWGHGDRKNTESANDEGLVAFGADSMVGLYSPQV